MLSESLYLKMADLELMNVLRLCKHHNNSQTPKSVAHTFSFSQSNAVKII